MKLEYDFMDHSLELRDDNAKSLLYKLDARVKLICTIATIIATSLMAHWQTILLVFVSCLLIAVIFKVPIKQFFQAASLPSVHNINSHHHSFIHLRFNSSF